MKMDSASNVAKDFYPNCDGTIWMRSCKKQETEPIEGNITGIIPKWLKGSLIRNGPGLVEVGDSKYEHLFDCSALLHCFLIENGNVTYRSKFLESEVYKKNLEANKIMFTEFGTKSVADPCNTIYYRVKSLFTHENIVSDNAMISVYPFGDELFAFGEEPVIHKIDKKTLETTDHINMFHKVGIVNHSSHPHVLKDGTVYNLGMSLGISGPVHKIVCFPKENNLENMFNNAYVVADIAPRWLLNPSYMHTFGMTENYFIVVQQPLSISLPSLLKCKIFNEPIIGSFSWLEDESTQINIVDKKSGKTVKIFQTEAFFFLHIINQYETDKGIILDICCYKDPSMIDCMYLDAIKNMQSNPDYAKMFRARPLRFTLPLPFKNNNDYSFSCDKSYVKPELLYDIGCETPRINYEQYLGKKYSYFYAISSDVDADNPGTIIKIDVIEKKCITWCEENCYPSEPIFVPKPNSKEEDDGILITALIWGRENTNSVGILILDAKTLKEIGRGTFQTASEVPKCLHGWFVPNN